MNTFLPHVFDMHISLLDMFNFFSLAYFILCIILLLLAKWVRDLGTPYRLEIVLTEEDNPALGISFTGYIFASGYIIANVIGHPVSESAFTSRFVFLYDLAETALWSFIGILLLNVSATLNNRFILPAFSNQKEIIEDRNIGVGACQAASYFASALIISAIVSGSAETDSFVTEILLLAIYYLFAHVALAIFAILFRKTSSYSVNSLMEAGNTAAGLSLGSHLVAIAIIFSNALSISNSLFYFFAAFINGSIFLLLVRFIFDRIIFKKPNIAKEISIDDNWAMALCQGAVAIVTALLLKNIF